MEKSQQLQGLCKASGVFLAPKMAVVMEEVMLDALLYSCREEYAIHIQQGLGSRKCGDSLPPK